MLHPSTDSFVYSHLCLFFYKDIYICIFMFAFVFVCLFCNFIYMFVLYLCWYVCILFVFICLYICIWRRSVVGVRLGRQLQLAPIPSAQLRLSHLQTKYTHKYKHKYKHICAYLYIYKHKYTSWNQGQETHLLSFDFPRYGPGFSPDKIQIHILHIQKPKTKRRIFAGLSHVQCWFVFSPFQIFILTRTN